MAFERPARRADRAHEASRFRPLWVMLELRDYDRPAWYWRRVMPPGRGAVVVAIQAQHRMTPRQF